MAAMLAVLTLTACKKEEESAADDYKGVLTKVRLGMPMSKIIALNSDAGEMYYESDTELWCINTDTDLMEVSSLIPEGDQFYYTDDSLISYHFKFDESDQEYYLTGYIEEIPCKISRETAESYYESKKERLIAKYSADKETVTTTMVGTEGVDLNLEYTTVMTLSSFEVTFKMQLTYDTVDGAEDYYGTYFSIEVKELKNKTAVEVKEEKK